MIPPPLYGRDAIYGRALTIYTRVYVEHFLTKFTDYYSTFTMVKRKHDFFPYLCDLRTSKPLTEKFKILTLVIFQLIFQIRLIRGQLIRVYTVSWHMPNLFLTWKACVEEVYQVITDVHF